MALPKKEDSQSKKETETKISEKIGRFLVYINVGKFTNTIGRPTGAVKSS